MPGIKELKTRIKSISGTRKVTRAMQMVSAAKMRKSQDATTRSRTYSSLAWELITNLTSHPIPESGVQPTDIRDSESSIVLDPGSRMHSAGVDYLLRSYPQATKIAIVILTTNRGMVGSLNSNLMGVVQKVVSESLSGSEPIYRLQPINGHATRQEITVDFVTYGRKGRDFVIRSHKEVLADFEKFDRTISTQDILPIAEFITKLYQSGKYQKVIIIYNHFVSTLLQKPTVKQLLPFASERVQGTADRVQPLHAEPSNQNPTDYLFEPDPTEVLNHLIPRIIESQIYQTILESEASEQSARMVMMKNATEAAGDLISDLTLTYNKLRQNKITTELAEITAGKIALE